jgi:hypothetical protein
MDTVQNVNNCINVPSSQAFKPRNIDTEDENDDEEEVAVCEVIPTCSEAL